MCGIVGVIQKPNLAFEKQIQGIFRDLIVIDTVRGFDSTGIFGAKARNKKNKSSSYIHKCAITGAAYAKEYKGIINSTIRDFQYVIGHNRWATVGRVNASNAHPFRHGKIVGAHNGTLYNKLELDPKSKFSTDSEALIARMDEVGEEEALMEANGALAVAWFNSDTGKLNIVRNKERPLFFSVHNKMNLVVIASELSFIKAAYSRNSVNPEDPDIDHWDLSSGHIISFSPDNPKEWSSKEIELSAPVKVSYVNHTNNASNSQKDRESTSDRLLDEKGLAHGDFVEVKWDSWTNYQHGIFGKLEGLITGSKIPIVCHGVNPNDKKKYLDEAMACKINFMSTSGVVHTHPKDMKDLASVSSVIVPYQKKEKEDSGKAPQIGERVNFYVHDFTAYNGTDEVNPFGKIEGTMNAEPWDSVVVHNVREQEATEYLNTDCETTVSWMQTVDCMAGSLKDLVILQRYDVDIDAGDDDDDEEVILLGDFSPEDDNEVVTVDDILPEGNDELSSFVAEGLHPIGPDGDPITLKEFDKLTRHGCVECGTNIFPEDSPHMAWTFDNQPYCPLCHSAITADNVYQFPTNKNVCS